MLFNNTNSVELVGKSAIFFGYAEPVVYSNHFTRLRAKREVLDPSYLSFWLQQQWQLKIFEILCNRWIGQAAVKNDKLLALEIPLPPLEEQERIVATLNERMAAVERARAATEAQLDAARVLPVAYLRAVFNSPEAQQWPSRRLVEVMQVQLGKMLSPKSKTGLRSRPYLRNANIQWGSFDLADIAEMDFTEEEERKFELLAGDLLVCEGGEPGRTSVWEGQISPCYYQKAVHRLRPRNQDIAPKFVMYRLWHGALRGEFSESHAKTTIAHLPAIRLEQLPIGIPNLEAQCQIVRNLTEEIDRSRGVAVKLEGKLEMINKLPAAILRRAFLGEL